MPIYTISNLQFSSQFLERPYKGVGVLWRLITVSSAGLVDPKTGSVPSYCTLWGTYMESTTSCSMDSTHSTRRGISCLAQVCCGVAFRFPPLGRLLLYSDRLGFFGMHKPTRQHHPCPSSYHLCSDITDWVKMLSPCRFHQCGWYGTRNSDSMLAQQGYLIPSSYHLRSDIVFMAKKTLCLCR